MDKLDAMNKDMFDEYVDGNGDGSATIEEIEMVSMNFNARALPKMTLKTFQFIGFKIFLTTLLGRVLHVPCNCSNDD